MERHSDWPSDDLHDIGWALARRAVEEAERKHGMELYARVRVIENEFLAVIELHDPKTGEGLGFAVSNEEELEDSIQHQIDILGMSVIDKIAEIREAEKLTREVIRDDLKLREIEPLDEEFSGLMGWALKFNELNEDGTVILPQAFDHMKPRPDIEKRPEGLVWKHTEFQEPLTDPLMSRPTEFRGVAGRPSIIFNPETGLFEEEE